MTGEGPVTGANGQQQPLHRLHQIFQGNNNRANPAPFQQLRTLATNHQRTSRQRSIAVSILYRRTPQLMTFNAIEQLLGDSAQRFILQVTQWPTQRLCRCCGVIHIHVTRGTICLAPHASNTPCRVCRSNNPNAAACLLAKPAWKVYFDHSSKTTERRRALVEIVKRFENALISVFRLL